jgi:hypothetical protein
MNPGLTLPRLLMLLARSVLLPPLSPCKMSDPCYP